MMQPCCACPIRPSLARRESLSRGGERPSPTHGERVRDPFGFYNGKTHHEGGRRGNGRANGHGSEAAARAASACDQALAVFDIEPPFTVVRLKARYKVLVKQHHPDA